MHPDFQQLMAKATQLTRNGHLQEATSVIQAALAATGNAGGAATVPAATAWSDFADHAGAAAAASTFHERFGKRGSQRQDRRSDPASRPFPAFDPADVTDVSCRPAPVTRAPGHDRIDGTSEIIRGSFTEPSAGTRHYRLFVPPHAAGQRLPLVVMLHGCTQDADDFARGTRMDDVARREGFAVLYPEQSAKANHQRCWNWFRRKDQGRERGEPALLAAMVRQVIRDHDLDAGRVFVAGLSAGGAMAAVLGRTHPDLFAAVGVHSGLAAGAASDLPSALVAMRGGDAKALAGAYRVSGAGALAGMTLGAGLEPAPVDPNPVAPDDAKARDEVADRSPMPPTIVFHGAADVIVHPSNGDRVIAQAMPAGGRIDNDPPPASGSPGAATKPGRRAATRSVVRDRNGVVVAEHWVIHGAPHAWSGGSPAGSYTDPAGPDATGEMVRFFLAQEARRPA